MRKIIAAMNITQDGFTADINGNLDWHFNYWDDELCESLCMQLALADTILLGANTYHAMANYWPEITSDLSASRQDLIIASLMNNLTKAVISKTIATCKWENTVVLNGKLESEIAQVKARPGKEILILGSSQLVSSLTRLKLIDRYLLWVHPVMLKYGKRSFNPFNNKHRLYLRDAIPFQSGVIQQVYE